MNLQLSRMLLLVASLFTAGAWALPGSTGTPLGGMGTSYVTYNARSGDFAAGSIIPPGGGDMVSDFQNRKSSSSGFHFYAGGQSIDKAKTNTEDAKCPLYTADFGKKGDVKFTLNAFGPYISGDNDFNVKMATSPLAFFEITATNEGTASVDVAAALEFANKSSTIAGLLGGADNATVDAASGNRAISFADAKFSYVTSNPNNTGNSYIMVECSKEGATYSAGAKGTFSTTGTLSNSDGNCVGAKCAVAAGESVKFRFVMAWWRTFVSGQDRYKVGKNDADNFYYHNFYTTSKEAAAFGMQHFETVKTAVTGMVNRVMGSNFPDWYKDRLLNNLYPLIHNSVWTKDGRAAYWEGGYGIIGTIDQGQHAAIWYMRTIPKNQWAELAYWLSNQFLREGIKGQIHHDFNISPGVHFSPQESRFIAPWDHWDRNDYWFQPSTTDWSDLNSMLIFKAYELMLTTGNLDSMKVHFPKILLTANRLYEMADEIGAHIPIRSRSTYDSEGDDSPQYACGVALAAYKAIVEMAKFVGDTANAKKFQNFYDLGRPEYKQKLFNGDYGAVLNQGWAEGHVGGYSWARYFCMEPIQDKDFIEAGCSRAFNIYSQSSNISQKVGGWHLYTYDHLGGALTGINRPDDAMKFHEWDYELYYKNLPDVVFWQSLFSGDAGPNKYFSYMTAPNVWRSYVMFMGYLLDRANKRLWVRPSLPTIMNKKIVNAALPEPYGWGTLNYDETGNAEKKLTQVVNVTYDSNITIKEVILKNNTGGKTPFVTVDNFSGYTTTIEDWGVEQNIRVTFAEPITVGPGSKALNIHVYSEKVGINSFNSRTRKTNLSIISSSIAVGKPIICNIETAGNVTIDLLALNGTKIGTLVSQNVTKTGAHEFVWNGKTANGNSIGAITGILRVTSSGKSVSRLVFNSIR